VGVEDSSWRKGIPYKRDLMMSETREKSKIKKLSKGRVTRSPEVVFMLKEFERVGGKRLIKERVKDMFRRETEKKGERLINSIMGIYLSGGKRLEDVELLRRDGGLERIMGSGEFYLANRLG